MEAMNSTSSPPLKDAFLRVAKQHGHRIIVGVAMVVMVVTRLLGVSNHIQNGRILFSGTDSWYHYRQVVYSVQNWPHTMPYDPWTGYPTGATFDQFGTIFDQFLATIALLVGLGSPTDHTIRLVLLVVPPLLGALVAVPVYYLGRRLAGRWAGVIATVVLALTPGMMYTMSVAGRPDHHVVETLLMATSVVFLLRAFDAAHDMDIRPNHLLNREWSRVRPVAKSAVLAGVAIAAYILVWPPALTFIAIIGVFTVFLSTIKFVRGESIDPFLIALSTALGTAFVVILPVVDQTFDILHVGFIHVGVLVLAIAGCAFLAVIARLFDNRAHRGKLFVASIGGSVLTVLVATFVLAPEARAEIMRNALWLFGHEDYTRLHIFETQPFLVAGETPVFDEYRGLFIPAIVGAVVLTLRCLRRQNDGDYFVLVWTVALVAMALLQIRFNYYLVISVAVLSGYAIIYILTNRDILTAWPDLTIAQSTVVAIIILVMLTTVFPFGFTVFNHPVQQGGTEEVSQWSDSLDWLQTETPDEGTLAGANNSLEYYGSYDRASFRYPDGTYGVIAWWEPGHWITTEGERIPITNPFQQNIIPVAQFLMASDESTAGSEIRAIPSDTDVNARYVMLDWRSIDPVTRFNTQVDMIDDKERSDYHRPLYFRAGSRYSYATSLRSQDYYETMVVRLYAYHGSARTPSPVVVQTERAFAGNRVLSAIPQGTPAVRTFDSLDEARDYANATDGAQVGGIGPNPYDPVPALSHYRVVHVSENKATESDDYLRTMRRANLSTGASVDVLQPSAPGWVKTFERVPGATVTGQGPANATVRATVELTVPKYGTFDYVQYAETNSDGEFTMTVPYSTTGYDDWGPENGYTNTSVRATEPYTFETVTGAYSTIPTDPSHTTTVHVSEGQVIGAEESNVSVTLGFEDEE